MNIKNLLTPKQIEICKQEKSYYQRIGVKKNLLQIALEHNFIQRKEKSLSYSLDLIKKYEVFFLGDYLGDGQDIVQIKTKDQLSLYKHFVKDDGSSFAVSYVPTEKTNNISINNMMYKQFM
mgnify:CR=1 FL=1